MTHIWIEKERVHEMIDFIKSLDGVKMTFVQTTNLSLAKEYLYESIRQAITTAVAEQHKQEPKRRPSDFEPLTDEQIAAMWLQYNPLNSIASFARAIEAAHGIGVKSDK